MTLVNSERLPMTESSKERGGQEGRTVLKNSIHKEDYQSGTGKREEALIKLLQSAMQPHLLLNSGWNWAAT